jgi:hypothetical protein
MDGVAGIIIVVVVILTAEGIITEEVTIIGVVTITEEVTIIGVAIITEVATITGGDIMVLVIMVLVMAGGDLGVTTRVLTRTTTLTIIHPTIHTRPQSYCHFLSSASAYIEREQDEPHY